MKPGIKKIVFFYSSVSNITGLDGQYTLNMLIKNILKTNDCR